MFLIYSDGHCGAVAEMYEDPPTDAHGQLTEPYEHGHPTTTLEQTLLASLDAGAMKQRAASTKKGQTMRVRFLGPKRDLVLRTVPFRVRNSTTITLSVYFNDPFRLQALTGTRTQRAVPLQGAQ